jgi:tRNA(Ile)-lysidine synthase
MVSGRLEIAGLRELSVLRAKNLLRYVLWQRDIQPPSAIRLEEILRQLRSANSDTRLHVTFGMHEIRTYRGQVYIQAIIRHPIKDSQQAWTGESTLRLKEWGGSVHFKQTWGQGLSQGKLMQAPVFIRARQGGEHYKPDCRRPRRSLKNLLQEASIPPWSRYTLPLLFCGERLAWVPGIGIDCEFQAVPEEMGIVPDWQAE